MSSKFYTDVQIKADISLDNETASTVPVLDASKKLVSSTVTVTEIEHVSGVTSSIQDQLDDKASQVDLDNHINDTAGAHAASAIAVTPSGNLAADDVQEALDELQGDIDGLNSTVIKKDGSVTFTADQSMGGFKLTSLAAPSAGSDAATKNYVDNALEGLKPKAAVRVATTVAGNISLSFANGSVIDSITLATGDRILIKDQAAAADNGIYVVQASGAPVRSSDFDSVSPVDEVNKAFVAVQEGTANSGKIFVQYGVVTTIGVDPINFTFFNSISGLTGGDGITISGSNIAVDHDGEGLTFVATQLSLELDGSTLSKSASGLKLSDTAVTPATVGTASQTVSITVDQQGRLTAASEQAIAITASQVTDFNEAAQDAVGAILTDTNTVDLTYTDGANIIFADVKHQMSITSDASGIKLVGDEATPGNTQYYGTDASGTKGFYPVATGSVGDIPETSFSIANNQTTLADITGLVFSNAVVRSFDALISVQIDAASDLFEVFTIKGIQRGVDWSISIEGTGDDSLIAFDITSAGQLQYTSGNYTTFVAGTMKFRAITTGV